MELVANLLENFKLQTENEKGDIKNIDIKFKVPSAKVKSSLELLDMKWIERKIDIDNKYKSVGEKIKAIQVESGDDMQLFAKLYAQLLDKEPEIMTKTYEKASELSELERNFYIKKLQAIINDKHLVTNEKALILEDSINDFWQEQNYIAIVNVVDFFIKQYPATMQS